MQLTIQKLLTDPFIVKAVIDRVQAKKLDTIYWRRYLDFEETQSRTFRVYSGTVTGVTAGSIIDKNSNKPIRERKEVRRGYGEVAYLGDKYQMDNDRLDNLKSLVDKFNAANTTRQKGVMTEIIDYITDDMRQVMLAPHKRMDLVVGELRSNGSAKVKLADNPFGIDVLDIDLEIKRLTPAPTEKSNFVEYLKEKIEEFKTSVGMFKAMELSRRTFNNAIIGSGEFADKYKMIFGNAEFATSAGLITEGMASQVFTGIGLPPVRIIEDYVTMVDGTNQNAFMDNRIALLPQDDLGKMMWHEPYEVGDPIPNKTYTRSDGGMYISNIRTDEGRFMEYGAEWIPNLKGDKMAIVDLDTMLGTPEA